ncbi:hypothetical protein EST38_g2436 [Candolleomyces aberdarensis]|uniref:SURP motif domain-containing protein n=1 Tax=Candolleomyces aberdarensis TaxID=2316362 RepID=A0A4Q2DTG5_9AGAR|nr:hypothetical protein EST38_g2436 [Candolleomyces aberdarensis]
MRRAQQSKRKREYHHQPNYDENPQQAYETQLQERQRALAVLHIQAHEADVVHGSTAKARARALEIDLSSGTPFPGTALIKLEIPSSGDFGTGDTWRNEDEDSVFTLSGARTSGASKQKANTAEPKAKEVWVDRYDARLLLDSFTELTVEDKLASSLELASPSSSSGWSDLPEDSRDTFFLSNAEAEDYHRVKRRRLLDEAWERRLKEREAEEADRITKEVDGTEEDSELSPETLVLMERTAKHLLSASNPAQLEMKILANYGADQRFSFLRDGGRWHQDWLEVKAKLKEEKSREENEKKAGSGLGGLTGNCGKGTFTFTSTCASAASPASSPASSPT